MKGKNKVIVEIIPSAIDPNKGDIIQLSALKMNDFKLIDRFDYRLNKEKVTNPYLIEMISYDEDKFKYLENSNEILREFTKWLEDYDLLILDNSYTKNYLKNIKNNKESICNYLNIEYSDDIIERIIEKYKLEPSYYVVDLLYEALIYESNNK